MPLVKQNVKKFEVFILGRPRIDRKRKKGWGRGRRERIEKGSRERRKKRQKGTELAFEDEDKKHWHLPLLGINSHERHRRFFAFFLIGAGKGLPLVDYSKIILTLSGPCEVNRGGAWGGGAPPGLVMTTRLTSG